MVKEGAIIIVAIKEAFEAITITTTIIIIDAIAFIVIINEGDVAKAMNAVVVVIIII